MKTESRVNLRSLDSLRGILAVYVLAGHARWLLWAGWETWRRLPHGALLRALAAGSAILRYGHEAVMVFFVLSGFFIHFRAAHDLAAGKPEERFNVADFFRRRVRRLVPPYVFALLLTLCLDAVGRQLYAPLYLGKTGDVLLDGNFALSGYSWRSVLPALCLLPGSAGRFFGSNGPLWSLGFEVVYYLMYPFWLVLRRRAGAAAAYGLGAALCGWSLAVPGLALGFPTGVLAHYPIWLAGAGLVELVARRHWPDWSLPVAAVLAAGFFAGSQARGVPPGAVLLCHALGGAATVFCFARVPGWCSEWRASRLTELFGLCSYTVYICHFPMVSLLCAAVYHVLGQRPTGGGLAVSGAVTVVLLCGGCFRFCERPFLAPRRRVLPPPAATSA